MKTLTVTANTYPVLSRVPHAEPGDAVEWRAGRGRHSLTRLSDGKTVFSRDCLPQGQDDTRPMVGVIARVASKGWYLQIEQTKGGES